MLRRRLEILAHGQKIDVGRTHVVHHLVDLQALLAQAQHDAGLGEDRRIEPLHRLQQAQRGIIARARADHRIEPRDGFQIVVVHVRSRGDDRLDGGLVLVAEIRGEDLDRRGRARLADRLDHLDELARAAVGQVVAVHRGDDDMLQAHLHRRLGDMLGLQRIDLAGHAGLDVAEAAGARADVAQDHHRRVFLGPALADIRARRFLAHGDEVLRAHQRAGLGEPFRGGGLDADPVGLADALGARQRSLLVHGGQIERRRAFRQPRKLRI